MLSLENTVLILIDIQGKLWNVMYEKEALLENTQKLIKGIQTLGVPIILTEQNPSGLGPTLPDLAQLMPAVKPLTKFCFSCYQNQEFHDSLTSLKRKKALVCGIEAHICIYQTTLELLNNGYEVQVVADAVSSRTLRNRDIALNRMQAEGAKLTTTEMVLFEILKTAESAKFKEISKIIR
jgi:nicotinamidase-related amidase